MRRLLLCLLLVGSSAVAFAEDGKPKSEGDYGGVHPGETQRPEAGKKPKKPQKGALSWIGFEVKDGGSQVFFQSASPLEVSQRVDGSTLVVSLGGVTRLAGNTWRHIDTRYFETPLSKIVAKKKGRGIEVRITFKNPKDVTQGSSRTATEADGLNYAYLSFTGSGTPAEDAPKDK